ncbi:unnamed protein product, partial [Discosporangium mesarthrocarpum]
MSAFGLDVLSKLAEVTSLEVVREEFPRRSDQGLSHSQFLAVLRKHIWENPRVGGSVDEATIARKAVDVFKQMDIRGDGEVSWEDFSSVSKLEYLPAVDRLCLVMDTSEVVHLLSIGPLPTQYKAKSQVVVSGGSELVRASCYLRHDTAYRPHKVHTVHSIAGQDTVITSSSLGSQGPHYLSCWDLPTAEERMSATQFLPALTQREETSTPQASKEG